MWPERPLPSFDWCANFDLNFDNNSCFHHSLVALLLYTVRGTIFECTLIGPEHSGEIAGNIAPFQVTDLVTNQLWAQIKGLNTTYKALNSMATS